ncbi:MAG TPA: class I SAM-dependent methyltransferase [Mycobacteriales bacterium]|nr:class I SAM-dependent methyltransferase [Mycobacteriales bacterium]
MDEHAAVNRRFWDEIAPHHAASEFYAVESFVDGADTLSPIEVAEVGDVRDKDLVHLQCHIGLDTLSWARRGAHVTGVDFSEASLEVARTLANRTGLPAEFIGTDVVEAPERLGHTFDIVFTTRGVLMWHGDLDAWAGACARLLKPGGVFYLLDIHPLGMALEPAGDGFRLTQSYFSGATPTVTSKDASYAVQDVGLTNTETREWIHPVGAVVSALIRAGITIEFLHEFPTDSTAPTTLTRDGVPVPELPGLFSIRGRR